MQILRKVCKVWKLVDDLLEKSVEQFSEIVPREFMCGIHEDI